MAIHLSLQDLVYGSTDADNLPTAAGKINQNNADTTNAFNAHTIATTGEHGVTGTIVGTSDSQTLTNKTIDATVNTITNIQRESIEDKFLRNDEDDECAGKLTALGGFDASSNVISHVSDPVAEADAANKSYTDDRDSTTAVNTRSWATANLAKENQVFDRYIPLQSVMLDSNLSPTRVQFGSQQVIEFDPTTEQSINFAFRLKPYQGGDLNISVIFASDTTSSGQPIFPTLICKTSTKSLNNLDVFSDTTSFDAIKSLSTTFYSPLSYALHNDNGVLIESTYLTENDMVSMKLKFDRPVSNYQPGNVLLVDIYIYES